MRRESHSFDSVMKTPYLWSEVERSDLESYAVKFSILHASHPEQDDSLQASFDAMYSRLLEVFSPLERSYLIDEVCASLPVGLDALNTLVLFVHAEPDPSTAAHAAVYMAHLAPLIGNDPLSGLSILAGVCEHEQTPERVRVGEAYVVRSLRRLRLEVPLYAEEMPIYADVTAAEAQTVPVHTRLGDYQTPGAYMCAQEMTYGLILAERAARQRTEQALRLLQVASIVQEWAEVWADVLCLSQPSPLAVYAYLSTHGEHLEHVLYERLGALTHADTALARSIASAHLYEMSAIYREGGDG